MSATTIRLWLVRETNDARLYCKHPFDEPETPPVADCVWVPKSIIEHCSKDGNQHMVKLPDWFIEKKGL